MALLTWSSKYSVGVQSMDSQHTVLFGILNDLHTAMMKGEASKLPASCCASCSITPKTTSPLRKH